MISTFFLRALLILSLSFSLAACGGSGGTSQNDDNEETVDADDDGYSAEDDCNDNNAAINPGATEIPNNDIDENCDGITLVIDEDDDGYNSDEDCDDDDPDINPGATEVCDGFDNDCDGGVDEGLSTDADGDGHYTIGSCMEPADDCNDDNAAINPEEAEIPNNGIDEDCDGTDLILNVLYQKSYDNEYLGMYAAEITDGVLSNEKTLIAPEDGAGRWASFSPDGGSVVFSYQNPEYPDTQGIYIMDLATLEITEVIDDGKWHMLPCFSPDGNWIVFEYAESESDLHDLAIISSSGGVYRLIMDTDTQSEEWAFFSPDGGRIIFHRREGSLTGTADILVYDIDDINNIATWTLTNLTDTPGISEEDPYYSPINELMIVFDADTGDGGLYETYKWDNINEAAPATPFIKDPAGLYGFSWPMFSSDGQSLYITVNKTTTTDLYVVPIDNPAGGYYLEGGEQAFLTGVLY